MFAGLTVLLVVLAFVYQPFLLVVAAAFGATTYFMWYQATGRLEASTRRRVRRTRARRSDAHRNAAGAGTRGNDRRARTARSRRTPTPAEAYRTLGLDPGASPQEIKRAYRTKVKEAHPDTKSGSEEAFKRVNRAYETLVE